MLKKELLNKINEIQMACDLHHERMMFAYNNLESLFPLNKETYKNLLPEKVSLTDQLIYRFSKLQDTMGNKLFRLILEGLEEDISSMPFIDILNKLEKLNLLDDHSEWLVLRETRNQVAHEYPFLQDELIEGLNELYIQTSYLSGIWQKMKGIVEQRFHE
ncbi:MAG: toxin-antitoxin system antitoxin subunit [Bacteroidetes bacterium]|nr:MAG: toxin-antitoxin system antitoxin subunit [Bacteroidota bacterium]